jgi:peptidoglycan/LPS O-acetylase OafA/YrhL
MSEKMTEAMQKDGGLKRLEPINWILLGAVRFFLAFIVLAEHLAWYIPESDKLLKLANFSPVTAVLGFLVISGFSIAASYEVKQKGFYVRRLLRILPVYIFGIFFSVLVVKLYPGIIVDGHTFEIPDITVIIGNLFFMQGLIVQSIEINPIVWTLSIEVFFYILTPFLNAKNKYFIYFVIASSLLFAAQRYIGFHYFSQMLYGLNILYLGWAWLLGFWFYHHRDRAGAIFFTTSIGILAIAINGYFLSSFWTLTWITTCAALSYGHHIKLFLPQFFKELGDISYPLYLLHIPFFYLIKSYGFEKGFYYLLAATVFCYIVDIVLDKPFKQLIKKFTLKMT